MSTNPRKTLSSCAIQTVTVASKEAGASSGLLADILIGDLASPIRDGMIDILIFNPPYVPTEAVPDLSKHQIYNQHTDLDATTTFERDSHMLSLSYAGGLDGMEITTRLLEDLPRILHPTKGVAYILLCAQNRPDQVKERLKFHFGFNAKTVKSSGKQAGWEKLQIVRVWKG